MKMRLLTGLVPFSPLFLALACSGSTTTPAGPGGLDGNNNRLADDLGLFVDANHDDKVDPIDINHDGVMDGPAVDVFRDGRVIGLALDTDCDSIYDSVDTSGDGRADYVTSLKAPLKNVPNCNPPTVSGSGGSGAGGSGNAGMPGKAGSPGTMGGAPPVAGSGPTAGSGSAGGPVIGELGKGAYQGTGNSNAQYEEQTVYRNGVGYKFIANGWGSGWQNHQISWNGTSFKVLSLNGSVGANYSPAGYPTMFCGLYTTPPKQSEGGCGLPKAITGLTSVKTGWRWKSNGSGGTYNAAWDIWLGNGSSLSSYLMVWLRDPPGQQPAGSASTSGATVPGVPGSWNIWTGTVNGHPIVNYVQAEGSDLGELEFDVMDVYRDATAKRKLNLPGNDLMAVAIGFEVWNGPITNLVTDDFYVTVK